MENKEALYELDPKISAKPDGGVFIMKYRHEDKTEKDWKWKTINLL